MIETPPPQTFTYQVECEQDDALLQIENEILQNQQVFAVRYFQIENKVVFAILLKPIYTKSERDNLKTRLTSVAQELTGQEVTLTFDNQVFRGISDDLTDEKKWQLLSLAQSRN